MLDDAFSVMAAEGKEIQYNFLKKKKKKGQGSANVAPCSSSVVEIVLCESGTSLYLARFVFAFPWNEYTFILFWTNLDFVNNFQTHLGMTAKQTNTRNKKAKNNIMSQGWWKFPDTQQGSEDVCQIKGIHGSSVIQHLHCGVLRTPPPIPRPPSQSPTPTHSTTRPPVIHTRVHAHTSTHIPPCCTCLMFYSAAYGKAVSVFEESCRNHVVDPSHPQSSRDDTI